MRLRGRAKVVCNADVKRVVAGSEPHTAARPEHLRLRNLLEPEQLAVEAPRVVLAAGRRGDLHVVEADDHVAP